MLFQNIAHGGEDHADTAASIAHFTPWYIAVPLFLLVIAAIGYLTWLVSGRNPGTVMMVEAIILLISGFTLFTISPFISIIAITGGLLLAGFMAFTGLMNGE